MARVFDNLHLPPFLLSAMRFRSASGAKLNGSDLRLLLTIWAAWTQEFPKTQALVTLPQRVLSHHVGRIQSARLEKSIWRLIDSEIWDGHRWIPMLMSHMTLPGTPPRPGAVVGPDWHFEISEEMHDALKRGYGALPRWSSFQIDSLQLQQLESRYSVTLYCRYRAWLSGYAKPTGVIGYGVAPSGKAISLDVSTKSAAEVIFGHHEPMAVSTMKRLFWTEGERSPMWTEMRRIDVDFQIVPLSSDLQDDAGLEINLGDIHRNVGRPKTLAAFSEDKRLETSSYARKMQRQRLVYRKRGIKSA